MAVAALERCITRRHIPYLRELIQSQWAMVARVDHKPDLPKMVQIVFSDLLAQMEEAMAAMAMAVAATAPVAVRVVVVSAATLVDHQ